MTEHEIEQYIKSARARGYSDEEIAQSLKSKLDDDSFERFVTSGIIGAITGSSLLGGLLGGSFLGGFLGDALEGTDDSWF